ncbi:hypothetical protein [Methanoplanus endosymbiosus]|uniref:Recombinase n=1 Tax=Methanoplanus endosymbiosus TaxID=33865 RepID=A0A9E7PN41_9EURY|nr:hypothetical protein [Methanoplanus endosymbiosus]UUX93318.1 hypothetical protein L6E24_04110 [Methanoplanus endosymbiosus]
MKLRGSDRDEDELSPEEKYKKYEAECERIRNDNERKLSEFEDWLRKKGLSDKTVKKHRSNTDFYINEFLMLFDDEPEDAKEGVFTGHIDSFLGYWFIRTAGWASKTAIKENAAGLKKFYQFMLKKEKFLKRNSLI